MTAMDEQALFEAAHTVRARAHAPYSRYRVGAAIEDEAGRLHVGCNVENAAYPQGACAEANAIGAMIAGGGTRIARIAVVGGPAGAAPGVCTPCGGCRQRIREFADRTTEILLLDATGSTRRFRLDDLLPESFGPRDLRHGP